MDGWMVAADRLSSGLLPAAKCERASLVRSVASRLVVRLEYRACLGNLRGVRPSAASRPSAAVLEANSNRANDDRTTDVLPS